MKQWKFERRERKLQKRKNRTPVDGKSVFLLEEQLEKRAKKSKQKDTPNC